MDSPFGEDRIALFLLNGSGGGGLTHLAQQLVESSGTKDHQSPGGRVAGIAKLVGHISRNHDHRTRFGRKPFIASLELVSSFKDVIELLVSIMHVQRHTLARHRGHFTDAVRVIRLAAGDADGRAARRPELQRWNKNGCWLRFHDWSPKQLRYRLRIQAESQPRKPSGDARRHDAREHAPAASPPKSRAAIGSTSALAITFTTNLYIKKNIFHVHLLLLAKLDAHLAP